MALNIEALKIWVAGHHGMVGSALIRKLRALNCNLIYADRDQVDLLRRNEVERFIASSRPEAIIIAAAKVGGILANSTYPANFLFENLQIAANIIDSAHCNDVEHLVFLGSSCIYPKFAPQPINEVALLSGSLEPSNEWYAIAKIAGLKLCQAYSEQFRRNYMSAMPSNLYGPGDNYDLDTSHVIPALLRKAHEAKVRGDAEVVVWGTGNPLREFLHVDDCAEGIIHLLRTYSGGRHVNIGSGYDLSIRDLAKMVAETVGFPGRIVFDMSKPDGTPRKLLDSTCIKRLGWEPLISLRDGLSHTYEWYKRSLQAD